jgi:membrane carboxypeptidase/penicillin-binding protein PbpC
MPELKPRRLKRYRAMLGAAHVELENLMRAFKALEQAGETTELEEQEEK